MLLLCKFCNINYCKNKNNVFCSRKCFYENSKLIPRKPVITLTCKLCKLQHNNRNAKKYCSFKCYLEYKKQKYDLIHLKECKFCKKQFSVRINTQVFCSRSCARKGIKRKIIKKQKIIFTKECLVCNKVFETHSKNKKVCGLECIYKNLRTRKAWVVTNKGIKKTKVWIEKARIRLSGSNNHMWIKDRDEYYKRSVANKIFHGLVNRIIGQLGTKKENISMIELGYSPKQFREHIEKQFVDNMNWSNYGNGYDKWHVDHIIPVNTFPVNTPHNIVNSLNNLRPLWSKDNLRRPKNGSDIKNYNEIRDLIFNPAPLFKK